MFCFCSPEILLLSCQCCSEEYHSNLVAHFARISSPSEDEIVIRIRKIETIVCLVFFFSLPQFKGKKLSRACLDVQSRQRTQPKSCSIYHREISCLTQRFISLQWRSQEADVSHNCSKRALLFFIWCSALYMLKLSVHGLETALLLVCCGLTFILSNARPIMMMPFSHFHSLSKGTPSNKMAILPLR